MSRLLALDAGNGSVHCRLHGMLAKTIPRLSDGLVWESATRSLMRMNNLKACRGPPGSQGSQGSQMLGPLDYFGNLESADQYLYTFKINSDGTGVPQVHRYVKTDKRIHALSKRTINVECPEITIWISGQNHSKSRRSNNSLFVNPGRLVLYEPLDVPALAPAPALSASTADVIVFTGYRARLVRNNMPFNITNRPLSSKDDFRAVTYLYQPGYTRWQITHGDGLFLEHHKFSQTITPLRETSGGYVILARRFDASDDGSTVEPLSIIKVEIPYGWTLIVDEDCIHGDATLVGLYMMCMTSDHVTMSTADTVFLQNPDGSNVRLSEELLPTDKVVEPMHSPPRTNLVFNPFSAEYWRLLWGHLN